MPPLPQGPEWLWVGFLLRAEGAHLVASAEWALSVREDLGDLTSSCPSFQVPSTTPPL